MTYLAETSSRTTKLAQVYRRSSTRERLIDAHLTNRAILP